MKKHYLISFLGCLLLSIPAQAARETYHVEVLRQHSKGVSSTTNMDVNMKYLAARFGYYSLSDLTITANGTDRMVAEVWGTDDVVTTFTNSTGHWFHADGTPCEKSGDSERKVAVKLVSGQFRVSHRSNSSTTEYTHVGDEFRFAELFVHDTDTVRYEFHVTLVDDNTAESMTSDQPDAAHSYYHRTDQNDDVPAVGLMQRNDETPQKQNWIQVKVGDKITMSAAILDTENYDSVYTRFNDMEGKKLRDYAPEPYVFTESATTDMSGQYTMRIKAFKKGSTSFTTKNYTYYIDVQENPGEPLSWEGMVPSFSYNFKDEYGEIPQPENILGDVGDTDRYGNPVNRVNGDWWTICWGSNLNTTCGTDTATVYQAARNLVKKYDTDFAYIRDVMGWPPDIRARKGYKSTVYIFGSGLKRDNTDNTTQGGYQSAIWYSDPNTGIAMDWPCVWASYYPFSRFRSDADQKFSDGDYQREAMIHEGIHALFADLQGAKNSAWFQEAGNTWLQSAMATRRSGTYGTPGFLDGCPFVAPFMPIECYSGWLQDGSFGGPSAEGVNMYNSSGQQVCTWRTYLGGNQYGNAFPIILSVMCGDGSIPWIWRYCKNRVLEGIGDSIGDAGMRNLIVEYRARQANFDFGGWSNGYRNVTSAYFGVEMGPEWEPYNIDCGKWKSTCYQRLRVNDADGWLAPDEEVNPGWSGANIIPIHVDTSQDHVSVFFRPEDTEERAILCYKTKAGNCYYSQIVRCGEMSIDITDKPANGVIFCVVCNTDYKYTGNDQRKKHWDYRIHLGDNCKGIANQYQKWFLNENTITDTDYEDLTPVEDVMDEDLSADEELSDRVRLMTGVIRNGSEIKFDLQGINPSEVSIRVVGISGVMNQASSKLSASGTYTLPSDLHHGLYFLVLNYRGKQDAIKVIIQ